MTSTSWNLHWSQTGILQNIHLVLHPPADWVSIGWDYERGTPIFLKTGKGSYSSSLFAKNWGCYFAKIERSWINLFLSWHSEKISLSIFFRMTGIRTLDLEHGLWRHEIDALDRSTTTVRFKLRLYWIWILLWQSLKEKNVTK